MQERSGEAYTPSIDQEIYSIEAARDPDGAALILTDFIDEVLYGSREQKPRGNSFLVDDEGFQFHFTYTIATEATSGWERPMANYTINIVHERCLNPRSAVEEKYEIRVDEGYLLTTNGGTISTLYTIEKLRGENIFVTWHELLGVKVPAPEDSDNPVLARAFGQIVDGQLEAREMCEYDINRLFDFMRRVEGAQDAESRQILSKNTSV